MGTRACSVVGVVPEGGCIAFVLVYVSEKMREMGENEEGVSFAHWILR